MNGYKVSIKREVIDALRDAFREDFANWDLISHLSVSAEYPQEAVHYPRIIVSLQEESLQSAGVGHLEIGVNEDGHESFQRHFRFKGSINFTIQALSSVDRDEISAALVNILAFPLGTSAANKFIQEIYDSDFIDMQVNNDVITPSGDSVEDVPWDDPTRKVYTASYSIQIMGEFFTKQNGLELMRLEDVRIYPYRPNQAVPSGSSDPADQEIPWT